MKIPYFSKWEIAAGLGLACMFALSTAQAQSTNLAVGIPDGSTRNDSYPCAGWGFSAPPGGSTTVNALGYWDANGTGLLTSHTVALYGYTGNPQYTLIAAVTVPAGTRAPLIDGYRWVGIPVQTLPDNGQGGNYYVCVATEGGDTWTTGIGGTPPLDPFFGSLAGKALTGGGDTAGNNTLGNMGGDSDDSGSTSYGGPNCAYFDPPLPPPPTLVSNIQPTAVTASVGETVVFTAAFSNSPPVVLQWQFIANGVTYDLNSGIVTVTNGGVVSSTLTLANVQTTNSGSYQLQASAGGPSGYTTAAELNIIAPIAWVRAGTFSDNSVLALAGAASNEVYGVDFGGSDAQTTANGYSFADVSGGNMTIASGGVGTYNNYLGGGGTTGDPALDAMLVNGIYNNGAGATVLSLNNLTVGQTYNVLALLADTRSAAVDPQDGPESPLVGFYGTDGEFVSTRQPYVFPAATPAVGAYALGTFTAVSTNEPVSLVTEFSFGGFGSYGNSQDNVFLLTKAKPPVLPPIYLAQDTTPTIPTEGTRRSVAFSAAFRNIPALNLQWQVIDTNGVTNNINANVVNVTNPDDFVVTSTLTISNLQLSASGASYQLEAVNATNNTEVAYSSTVLLTVLPAITWVAEGTFTSNSVLELAGPAANEVYGVDFGGSGALTTANGYSFNDYQTTGDMNVQPDGTGYPMDFGGYLVAGASTGDPNLDTILTYGIYGHVANTGTLENLTVGRTYNVLALLDDTRGAANSGGSPNGFTISDGATTSPQQPFLFANGLPAVGGYILGTFTAASTNQAYTVFNNPGSSSQYNAVLVTIAPTTPPVINVAKVSGSNLILTGSGGTPNAGYTWLQATNLSAPIYWTTNNTGTLDGAGSFSNNIPIVAGQKANFLRLRLP